ncbi:unnamed protein product [Ectocarpus sp. 6 AP-2014]
MQAPTPSKALYIVAKEAKGLKNVQMIGRQDPYLKLWVGRAGTKVKTRVHEDGGKVATWNETFVFDLQNVDAEECFHFEAKNKNVTDSKTIGMGKFPLKHFGPVAQTTWHKIYNTKGKPAGEVLLEGRMDDRHGMSTHGAPMVGTTPGLGQPSAFPIPPQSSMHYPQHPSAGGYPQSMGYGGGAPQPSLSTSAYGASRSPSGYGGVAPQQPLSTSMYGAPRSGSVYGGSRPPSSSYGPPQPGASYGGPQAPASAYGGAPQAPSAAGRYNNPQAPASAYGGAPQAPSAAGRRLGGGSQAPSLLRGGSAPAAPAGYGAAQPPASGTTYGGSLGAAAGAPQRNPNAVYYGPAAGSGGAAPLPGGGGSGGGGGGAGFSGGSYRAGAPPTPAMSLKWGTPTAAPAAAQHSTFGGPEAARSSASTAAPYHAPSAPSAPSAPPATAPAPAAGYSNGSSPYSNGGGSGPYGNGSNPYANGSGGGGGGARPLPLPPGWEEKIASDGRTFFVDHNCYSGKVPAALWSAFFVVFHVFWVP